MSIKKAPVPPVTASITLESEDSPVVLKWLGDNGRHSNHFDNVSKYMGDYLINFMRTFSGEKFTPVCKKAVRTKEEFEAAAAAVTADPVNNGYLTLESVEEQWAEMALNLGTMLHLQAFSEKNRLGIQVIRNTGYVEGSVTDYAQYWERWTNLYTEAYLYGKHYGNYHFGWTNEPDGRGRDWDEYIAQMKTLTGAIRAGSAAAGFKAVIYAPCFASGSEAPARRIIREAHEYFDVYNWQTYVSNPGSFAGRIHQTNGWFESEGVERKPFAITEFNITVNKNINVYQYHKMPAALNIINIYKALIENGIYSLNRFLYYRNTNTSQFAAMHTGALVNRTSVSENIYHAVTVYYGLRIMSRAVHPGTPKRWVRYTQAGLCDTHTVMATKSGNYICIMAANGDARAATELAVDFSAFGITAGKAHLRLMNIGNKDVYAGISDISGGKTTVGIPADSVILITVPARPDVIPAAPDIHRAFQNSYGNELWWRNDPEVLYYTVERKSGADGEWAVISETENNSFYTDYNAQPDSFYRVRAAGAGGTSISREVGPLTPVPLTGNALPLNADLASERGFDGWTVEKGAWLQARNFEDPAWLARSGPGAEHIITTGSNDWTDYAVKNKFHPQNMGNDARFGLYFRYRDADNHYLAEYVRETETLYIRKMKNGAASTLGQRKVTGLDIEKITQRNFFGAEVMGNSISAVIDTGSNLGGGNRISVVDPDPVPSGKIGQYVSGTVNFLSIGMTAAPIFYDFFDERTDRDRVVESGSWAYTSGSGRWYCQSEDSGWGIVSVGESYWHDIDVVLRIKPVPFRGAGEDAGKKISLFLHYRDADNHYRYDICADNKFRFAARVNGRDRIIAEKDFTVVPGKVIYLNVHLDRNLHKIYIGGAPFLYADGFEPSLYAGKVAFGTHNAAGEFNSLIVNASLIRNIPGNRP